MTLKHGSIEFGPPAAKGEGRARRSALMAEHGNELVSVPLDAPEVTVLAAILDRCVKKFGDQKALGYREVVRTVSEEKEITKMVGGKEVKEKKTWNFFELSDYKYWTFNEFGAAVKDVGSALVATGHTKEHIFNIYASTSHIWQTFANGCASQGITFATAYDSLGEEGLEHSITEPSVYGMFTNANLMGTVAKVVARTPTLKVLVYDGKAEDVAAGSVEKIKNAHEGIQVYTLADFMKLGKEKPAEPSWGTPESIATIMYTSGSTGRPKGVLISNANVIAAIAAVQVHLPDYIRAGESYIAYLPLAHIMEFVVEMCLLYVGALMGYGTVKTLTDASVRNCAGDLRAFKPSILVGVPAVFELIRKGILGKVKSSGAIKSNLFNVGMAMKRFGGRNSILGGIADAVVFKAVRESTGGNLRVALSGGAQISRETQEFLSTALVTIVQGYGMTETTAMCAILPPALQRYSSVGFPMPSSEIKLVDVPEANYFSTNNPPQGEIYVRGPSVSKGYYKREDVTKETYTEDGWMLTGDIGQWNPDGSLSIIDRKKNLVKLSGGEYIALERLESVYKSCSYVANICLHADGQANRAMAIIFPHEVNIKALVKEKNFAGGAQDLDTICADKAVADFVLKDLNAVGKKAGLKPLEALQVVVLSPEEWTPQNGLLTAAQKLQRKAILAKYKSQVDAVYP